MEPRPVALLDHRVVPHGSTKYEQKQRDLKCVDCGAVMLYYRALPDECNKEKPT